MTKKLLILLTLLLVSIPTFAQHVDTAWVRTYDGPVHEYDRLSAIAVDAYGNVYVTGESEGLSGDNYATVKYDAQGNERWVARYDGPGSWDRPYDIAVDGSGNVYVTGRSHHWVFGVDYATAKYDSSGNELWVKRYDGPPHYADYAYGLAVRDPNNIYVTGAISQSDDPAQNNFDYATIKYDSAGTQLWVRTYNGQSNLLDMAHAIALDSYGNIYVTGKSTISGNSYDYLTIKYSPGGTRRWVARYNGPGSYVDEAYAIAVDGSGNVYVTGRSSQTPYPEPSYDYATVRYDSSGVEIWVRRYNGPGDGDDEACDIATDAYGNVYVTGTSLDSDGYYDYATMKYEPDGDTAWVRRYDGPSHFGDMAKATAVDDSGNVCVTGSYGTIKYDTDGNQVWADSRYGGLDIAVDGYNNIYVASGAYDGKSWNYATIKYVQFLCGDVNNDGVVDAADVLYLINYLFISGSAPDPIQAGDVNRDGAVDAADVMYLINYLFIGGSPPCEP